MGLVRCVEATRDPFACEADISQTRLPVYLHAAVAALTGSRTGHYVLSATFAMANLVLVHLLARRRVGVAAALLATALTATAPATLASGRMLLSHANVIFSTFALTALALYDVHDRTGRRRWFWASAVSLGLALASSVLALAVVVMVAGFWVIGERRPRWWQPPAYVAVGVGVFLATTIVYLRPQHLGALVEATAQPEVYPFPQWNVLELGTHVAPAWYSPLLFAIRLGPWWAALFLATPLVLLRRRRDDAPWRGGLVLWLGTAGYLLGKSSLFHYDAPHQQAPFYPLVFLFVALVVVRSVAHAGRGGPAVAVVIGFLLVVQVRDTIRFFPNHLFYGAQYGQRFIGEFYGPAVLHKQGRAEVDAEIDRLARGHPTERFLVADHTGFEEVGPQFVAFTKRDPAATYRFALVDRLHATHLTFPEREEYNALLAERYRVRYSLDYPVGEWAYRIYEARSDAAGAEKIPVAANGASTSTPPSTSR